MATPFPPLVSKKKGSGLAPDTFDLKEERGGRGWLPPATFDLKEEGGGATPNTFDVKKEEEVGGASPCHL